MDSNTITTNRANTVVSGNNGLTANTQLQANNYGAGTNDIVCDETSYPSIHLPVLSGSDNTIQPIDPGQNAMIADIIKFFITMLNKILASLETSNRPQPLLDQQIKDDSQDRFTNTRSSQSPWSHYDQPR